MILTKYLIIGIIVTGLGGALATKLYINEARALAVKTEELKSTEAALTNFKSDVLKIKAKLDTLEKDNQAITLKDIETTRTLEGLRNRESTVLAKKSLVALKINKAFQKRQKELACTTGDFTLC